MIPYHGTPIGGDRNSPAKFLQGRHALVPFARQDDLPIVATVCKSFVFDCSSYSTWNSGKGAVDVDEYIVWCDKWHRHPGFSWAIIPDVIDGTEEQNYRLVRDWVRYGLRFQGVPVWHLHESTGYLEWLVANFRMIAIGSSGQWETPGTPAWWARMEEARPIICDEDGRPKCKIHGLRMLDPEIVSRIPLASGDSTNAAVNCGSMNRFGMYPPPTAAQRATVIGDRIEVYNSPAVWVRQPLQQALIA